MSNALNHPERVAAATQEVIQDAIKKLGFVRNQQARVLTGAPSSIIGLIVLDLVSPFFMELAHAVEKVASESDLALIICNSENQWQRELELLQMLAGQRVRGVLVTPASDAPEAPNQRPTGMSTVFLDYEPSFDACSVTVDHVEGARLVTHHLLELGHRDFAYVAGPAGLRQFALRAQGISQALSAAGIDPAHALRQINVAGMGIAAGAEAGEQLLQLETMPTAVLCANDLLAFGVFRTLTAAGIRIPDDVSLAGYDDIDFAADWIVPLTSVRQPTSQMGAHAAALLLQDSSPSNDHQHQQLQLSPELVVRNTTGPRR